MTTTIGQLANVPAPGDPIRSPWAQDVTRICRHTFATKAALDAAAWPGLADGALAYTIAEQLEWERVGGVWRAAMLPRLLARSTANVRIPGFGTGGVGVVPNRVVTLPAPRILEIRGRANFSAAAGIGVYMVAMYNAVATGPRLAQQNDISTGAVLSGSILLAGVAGNNTLGMNAAPTTAGVANIEAAIDPSVMEVFDWGPTPLPALADEIDLEELEAAADA